MEYNITWPSHSIMHTLFPSLCHLSSHMRLSHLSWGKTQKFLCGSYTVTHLKGGLSNKSLVLRYQLYQRLCLSYVNLLDYMSISLKSNPVCLNSNQYFALLNVNHWLPCQNVSPNRGIHALLQCRTTLPSLHQHHWIFVHPSAKKSMKTTTKR